MCGCVCVCVCSRTVWLYREGRGTADQIRAVRQLIEKALEHHWDISWASLISPRHMTQSTEGP